MEWAIVNNSVALRQGKESFRRVRLRTDLSPDLTQRIRVFLAGTICVAR